MNSKLPFSEIAEVVMGQSPTKENVNSESNGFPLLNGPTEFTARYPNPIQFTTAGKKFSQPDDILFCVRGSTTGRMNYSDQKYAIGRGIAAIRGKNGYPTPYVRAVIEQNLERLLAAATGSTFPNVGRDLLLNFEVEVTSPERATLANDLIVSLEDKIESNRQTNQTLEQIAQAIFKSWFVDFEPVKAKIEALSAGGSADDTELAAMSVISAKTLDELNSLKARNPRAFNKLAQTAALFPSAMQESEFGEIPEGWSYCTFGDISVCFDSKRVPLSKRKREEKQPGTIPYYGATSVMDYVNEWIFDDTYLLLGEDGSVVKDDGTPFVQYIWGKSWVNNHAHVLQGNNGVSTEHLMVFIKGANIASYVTGAVQLKLNQKNMNSIPFLKASTEINLVFQGVLNGLYDAYKNNTECSQSLSSLRDSLLPRLLSGEMELKDKE